MAGTVRSVNEVPIPRFKIKKELLSDEEEEESITCKICFKSFASDVALRNHARMEHTEAFINGDPALWVRRTETKGTTSKQKSIEEKTRELIATMGPTSMMSLASKDVSYIIVKSEGEPDASKRRKTDKPDKDQASQSHLKKERQAKASAQKKEKEPQPITGPFECLQPSTLVADGTCHQIFFSCCEYSAHYRDEHTRRRKGLRCQVCEKPLNATDSQQSVHFCDVCSTGFPSARALSEHAARAHVKLKPFECSVCLKRFTQQGGLQQHTRMHTGYRPYACSVCSKTFTQKSGLDQHFRIHTKVRPYRCVICNKTFCQSVHLKQHMRTHTNVSPFQCGICEKRFKQSSHLNYHLRLHNPATMSDEQKRKYMELVGLIEKETVEVKAESVAELEQSVVAEVDTEYVLESGETWCVSLD